MDRRVVGTLLLCLGLLLVAVGGVAGAAPSVTDSVQDTDEVEIDSELRDSGEVDVLVSLAESGAATTPAELQAHASESQKPLVAFAEAREGVSVETQFWLTNAALVTVDTDRVALEDLAAIEGVEALDENGEVQIHQGATGPTVTAGDVTATDYTYGLEQANVPTAWNTHGTKGAGASVAVLDTGVDASHPDLNVTKWQEFDGDGNPVNSTPNDGQGHGTHVSGTVSGAENPAGDVPTFGVAPAVDLYGVKILDDSGSGSFAQIIAGMEWAVQEDADVISMSLGATGFYDQMIDPVRNAVNASTTVVTSSGNSGEGSSGSPGNVYDAISVGASNSDGNIASFSSGEHVTTDSAWQDPPADWPSEYIVPSVAAPGVDVLSSVPGGGYDGTYSGTSMAAPHVSGIVALAESALDKEISPSDIEAALEATAFKPGDSEAPAGERDTRYGSGIVDANAFIAFLDGLEDQPFLTLSANAPGTVEQNETLGVNYTVENLGGAEGTESQLNLLINGSTEDSDTGLTIAPDDSVSGTLTFDGVDAYPEGDVIEWTVEMVDNNKTTSGSTAVGLQPGPNIGLQSIDYPETVAPDEDLNVDYTLENLGAEDGTESFVDLLVNGTDSTYDDTDQDVTVPAGGTTNGTLTLHAVGDYFEPGDPIPFSVELWDSGDVAEGESSVASLDGPVVSINSTDAPETVETDQNLTVAYTLANIGNESGTESAVNLVINGTTEDTDENVTIPAQDTTSGTLVFEDVDQYQEGDVISYTVELVDFEDSASGTVGVGLLPEPEIVVQSLNYSDPLAIGAPLEVEYTLENLGAEDGTESFVDLKVEGTDSGFDDTDQNVMVPGGETVTGDLELESVDKYFDIGDNISFTVELWDFGDVAAGETMVAVPDEPVLELQSIDAADNISAGETLTVDYTIANIGSEAGTESAVDLLVNGTDVDGDENVTVPAQSTANGTLTADSVEQLETLLGATETATPAQDDSGVRIDIERGTGVSEALVTLEESATASSPTALQAHASETQEPLVEFAEAHAGVTLESQFWLTNAALVTVDTDGTALRELAGLPAVESVVPNAEFEALSGQAATAPAALQSSGVAPAADDYTYGLEQINAPDVWEQFGTQGEGASVAVLDTGVDASHPDLDVAKWQEFDGDGNPIDSDPNDGNGHGTHVSGTVTGAANPAGDVPAYGVAPEADLYGGKVLADDGSGSLAQVIGGMEWAVDENADVISMSLGAAGYFPSMIDPVTNAQDAGIPVVAAAGNNGEGTSGSPGNVYDSIAIGASDSAEDIAGFSGGETVDTDSAWGEDALDAWPDEYVVPTVSAPGVGVLSSVPGGGYDSSYSGTSMATPHVAGVVALAESAAGENLSVDTIEQALEQTAFKPNDASAPAGERDTRYGSGIVDALGAVDYVSDPPEGELITYTVSLSDTGDSITGQVLVEESGNETLPPMPGQDDPPKDHDGDNLYEDVDGDGKFDIFDVQMFFTYYDHEMMDDHGAAFDFNEDGKVDIFDVQAQFGKL